MNGPFIGEFKDFGETGPEEGVFFEPQIITDETQIRICDQRFGFEK